MSPRLAFRFILLSLILAVLMMGIAVVLNSRLRQLQQVTPPPLLEAQLASMAMKLDANGLGSQIISGTQISVRLSPYPVQAGQVIQVSVVATLPFGQLATITPTLYLTPNGPEMPDATQIAMTRDRGGGYVAQAKLFPESGVWQARIGFYLNPTETSSVILLVEAE